VPSIISPKKQEHTTEERIICRCSPLSHWTNTCFPNFFHQISFFSADEKDTALTNAKWSKLLKTFCKAARHKANSGTENLIPHEFPRQFVTKGYVTRLSRTLLFIDLTCQCVIEPLPNPINLEDCCWELRTLRQLPHKVPRRSLTWVSVKNDLAVRNPHLSRSQTIFKWLSLYANLNCFYK
jgi:hypothetical protein